MNNTFIGLNPNIAIKEIKMKLEQATTCSVVREQAGDLLQGVRCGEYSAVTFGEIAESIAVAKPALSAKSKKLLEEVMSFSDDDFEKDLLMGRHDNITKIQNANNKSKSLLAAHLNEANLGR